MMKERKQEKLPASIDVLEAKKEMARMRFRRALGESVSSHRFRELRKSIAVTLTKGARGENA
ncbi:MAG: 50S ribosomal protein L29 [Holosporales bacterium]|jgi:ribosomal protein L29|nr:50S ribosomal protein L29 [Holosporales bacterium]